MKSVRRGARGGAGRLALKADARRIVEGGLPERTALRGGEKRRLCSRHCL